MDKILVTGCAGFIEMRQIDEQTRIHAIRRHRGI